MRRLPSILFLLTGMGLLAAAPARAAGPSSDYQPDPKSVQRYGPAYRYPQAGWIVLHIEGEPYERGYQHGRLLAPEIAAHLRCFAAVQNPKAPVEGWKQTRTLVNALFLRRYEKEFLEEMKGIADGATAAGARFDNRAVDLVDVVALNAWPEIETLDSALEATPTGLEGLRFPYKKPLVMPPPPKPMHCSAFAATGPATADGKIVFGHITMFNLYPSSFYNVWIDIKPAKGHRVLMQTYPAGIQSGLDYYMNDAGLLVLETTLAQTRFDIKGMSVASRIRQVLQYADSIDKAVEILKKDNNGLYTNEWLLADIKTNEIAMFELGTHKSKLYRSSKNEWVGGTEGFYWGCNNTKDLEVRLETVASVEGRPANVVFRPSDRDKKWLQLYAKHKGKINADFGKEAFTTPPLAAYYSVDAKFTTTELAKQLKTWGIFGPPLGRTWQPTPEERQKFPEIKPLVSNPWTILHAQPPAKDKTAGPVAIDLPDKIEGESAGKDGDKSPATLLRQEEPEVVTVPAWHGTLLPKTDADVWLAAAFADYEKFVALEKALRERADKEQLTKADRERLAVDLFAHRSLYLANARAASDVPLVKTRSDFTQDHWYRVAAGKGVLLLHELRRLMDDSAFEDMMDAFGRTNAGKQVTTAQFQAHVEKWVDNKRGWLFEPWLTQPGLPSLRLDKVTVTPAKKGHEVKVEIICEGTWPRTPVEVTVETAKGEVTKKAVIDSATISIVIETDDEPRRVVVDKHGRSAKANGGVYSVLSFHSELEQTLIVYGTADEVPTNREAAEALQQAIRERWTNYTVPIKADKDVTDDDLKSQHVVLIGRPDSNKLTDRFRAALPITFGSRSFVVGNDSYAHPDSAVIAAGENPLNKRYSIVVVAGLGAASTLQSAPLLGHANRPAEVLVLANGAKPKVLVMPAKELVREVEKK